MNRMMNVNRNVVHVLLVVVNRNVSETMNDSNVDYWNLLFGDSVTMSDVD